MTNEQLSRVEAIQQHIENARYSDFKGGLNELYDEMVTLNAWRSFAGQMFAESKRDLNHKKVSAYTSLIASQRAVNINIPPSIAKDYIASKCADLQYNVDLCERVNSNLAYYIDTLRSILSSLKEELKTISFQS